MPRDWLDRGELERLIARGVEEHEALGDYGEYRRERHAERDHDHEHRHHDEHGHDSGRGYRDGHHRKRRWFEALGDIFD